jgi:hypothetical protein
MTDRVELAQHFWEMGLEVRCTIKPTYNHPYSEWIYKLHPIPKGIKINDFK